MIHNHDGQVIQWNKCKRTVVMLCKSKINTCSEVWTEHCAQRDSLDVGSGFSFRFFSYVNKLGKLKWTSNTTELLHWTSLGMWINYLMSDRQVLDTFSTLSLHYRKPVCLQTMRKTHPFPLANQIIRYLPRSLNRKLVCPTQCIGWYKSK